MADGKASRDFNAKIPASDFDRAIYMQDVDRLKELIGELRIPKEQRAEFLTGELRKACALAFSGAVKTEIIDALIDAGGRMNQPHGHDASPFGIICRSSDVTLLRHMIARGADVNADVVQDQFGAAKPLHYACDYSQNPEMVQELLSHRANPNAKGFLGQTPLHAAAAARPRRAGNEEDNSRLMVIDLLLRHGAKVNAVDKSDQTPLLSLVAHTPDVKTAEKLIDAGANLKHVSRSDGSALHIAAERGLEEITGLLVRRGAPLLLKNSDGLTPRESLLRVMGEPGKGATPALTDTLRLLETAEGKIRPRDVRKFVKHKWGL